MDPEAELIFGAIKDENMNGKIRVSIVATALDGHKSENRTVLNMVSRIQNRNTGYSENLFSHNSRTDSNTLNSIEGATALKLDENYEINEEAKAEINFNNTLEDQQLESALSNEESSNDIPSGVSIENAAYMENNINETEEIIDNNFPSSESIIEEYTPKLFSEEQSFQEKPESENIDITDNDTEQLFDQDLSEEEDFEIPA